MPVVLIVDDEPDIRESVQRWLSSAGMSTGFACDGMDCLAQAAKLCPDLIVMDVLMPRMNGITAIRELRNNDKFATTPILVLSASLADENEAYIAGANQVLAKPYQGRQLIQVVQQLLLDETRLSDGRAIST
ncbi:response regulator [Rhodopirellula baltica]|uniref:response regulator n=1 Tax=Rhodopirellula baltica TaxID=265606 RepID=UPI000569BBB6|nr:response regulator [Rhodopirellula baltica]